MKKKQLFRWLKILGLLYGSIGIAFYYLQDTFLFHPVPVEKTKAYVFDQPFTELNIPYNKDANINILQFPATGDTASKGISAGRDTAAARPDSGSLILADPGHKGGERGVVLFFHGNKRNVSWYADRVRDFTSRGYAVWMPDYPGFGKSTGPRNEKMLYEYALQTYKLARAKYQPSQIIIYGKSLGTGIAAQLASIRNCRRLILESPYYSMTSLVRHYLPIYPVGTMLHYHLPTNEYLPLVTDPIAIFHGTEDGLIPIGQSKRLKPLLKPGDAYLPIGGASHNDVKTFPQFHRELDSLLSL